MFEHYTFTGPTRPTGKGGASKCSRHRVEKLSRDYESRRSMGSSGAGKRSKALSAAWQCNQRRSKRRRQRHQRAGEGRVAGQGLAKRTLQQMQIQPLGEGKAHAAQNGGTGTRKGKHEGGGGDNASPEIR